MSSFAPKIDLARQYLSLRVAEHNIRATNVVNAETPGFKAKQVNFEAELDKARTQTSSEKYWKLGMNVRSSSAVGRPDGNNVSLDQEMAAMAKNSVKYMSAIEILNKQMGLARYAITMGGR